MKQLELFKRDHYDFNEVTPYQAYGIECGYGWYKLFLPLIEACRKKNVKIAQVKEKFGMLRFYASTNDPELCQMIEDAENQSALTCAGCGAPTKKFRSLCKPCEKRWQDELASA